ncbi:GNAT family N-acetyltransferase [Streptomyces boncukensis]|uniref:GNAT family N-acetyltransferase n=1 Tax=Streptomyces boncukensis TaxID=2711219 RepID=A0A6G4WVI9_9ACTN|nr:GNAT family N-acetyltransferase [Streptomyces boncukensis]NGO68640.1 GNAT family N-acetyltransferase [Streptomyces boncukensis]
MPQRPELRTLSDDPDDLHGWLRAIATGFYRGTEVGPEEVAARRGGIDPARTQGVYDAGRWVATYRTTPQQLTVPGGAVLPSCAVTNVTVSPTHRRRGLLSEMMARGLTAAKERGDAFASLISAEYPIYGRFGFGPAAWTAEWEVEVARTGLDRRYSGPADWDDGGRVDLVDAAEYAHSAAALHEVFRAQPHRQGAVDRTERSWRTRTGGLRFPGDGFVPPFFALYRDADGRPRGAVAYAVDNHWSAALPEQTATVHDLFATTADAERALWRYLLAMDWVLRVRTGPRAPDDLLPLLLPDPRAAKTTAHADFLWLRPLDVPRMLAARTYAVPGTVVLELRDKAGFAQGRFRLEAGEDGTAACEATRAEPDLCMDAGELGTLYLGDESVLRLVALGRVAEQREGAAARADALFRTARRAWCPDIF